MADGISFYSKRTRGFCFSVYYFHMHHELRHQHICEGEKVKRGSLEIVYCETAVVSAERRLSSDSNMAAWYPVS